MTSARLLIAPLLVVALSGCGDVAGNASDRAFAREMTAHHELAVAMAGAAKPHLSHAETKQFARHVMAHQASEVSQLRDVDGRLADAGVEVGSLGLSHEAAGMHMDAGSVGSEASFITQMAVHHVGALRMARSYLAKGENETLRALAETIIADQTREIADLRRWVRDWYPGHVHG